MGQAKYINLINIIFYFEDKKNNLSLEEILKIKFYSRVQIKSKEIPSFGITASAYWFYIEYEANGKLDDYLLEIEYPLLIISYFYLNLKGEWVEKKK